MKIGPQPERRLGRLSGTAGRIVPGVGLPGLERLEGQFPGKAYAPHRHDTYAIGLTLRGVQVFRYRGQTWRSIPGRAIVLHPDELHDGGAGNADGLRYRMLYLAPSWLADSLGRTCLPFLKEPVVDDRRLCGILAGVLRTLREPLCNLEAQSFCTALADCLSILAGRQEPRRLGISWKAIAQARAYIEANLTRTPSSAELEQVTGLDRFALSRQFRAAVGTSPHRFLITQRVRRARQLIEAGLPLADIAAQTGFADQSHLNRHFKKTLGMTPGRWAALVRD